MEDRKLTEKESLEVITSMIARTKQRYLGSGNTLIMWGVLVVITSMLVWALLATTRQNAWNWLWFAIPVIGFPTSLIMKKRENREKGAITYSDRVTSRLWTIFSISIILLTLVCLGFYLIGEIDCWIAMLVYSLLLAPGSEIAQGLVIKEKSLVFGGMIGLSVGLIALCCSVSQIPLDANWFMPVFITAWIAMMISPGYILNSKSKDKWKN